MFRDEFVVKKRFLDERWSLNIFPAKRWIEKRYIEDITCPRVDMNFIFEWSTRYLTSERSERVRYRVDHEKIKFISISGHVMEVHGRKPNSFDKV